MAAASLVLALVASAAYGLVIRRWHLSWGATEAEARMPLPGDDLVPDPRLDSTRAITIGASPADIWPWLVQMGKDRGGFYSYDWLENLAGFDIHSTDRIIPELQSLTVGERIWLHANRLPLRVAVLDPQRALVLGASWAFILHPIAPNVTRLIIRSRGEYAPDYGTVGNFFAWRVFYEPAYFVMERKMLLSLKERAEAGAARRRFQADQTRSGR